jgi:hypothetical protein
MTDDAQVPVPMRWRNVCAGDTLHGNDGQHWRVQRATRYGCTATNGEQAFTRAVKPEQATTVYLPRVELDCLTLLRGLLGARVESRRLK